MADSHVYCDCNFIRRRKSRGLNFVSKELGSGATALIHRFQIQNGDTFCGRATEFVVYMESRRARECVTNEKT